MPTREIESNSIQFEKLNKLAMAKFGTPNFGAGRITRAARKDTRNIAISKFSSLYPEYIVI